MSDDIAGVDKATMREAARALKPQETDEEFDAFWARFEALKTKAEALKAQGIAIHPTFGNQP